ncbi:MAG: hypothetical protein ACFWTJ_04100 [Lachnoclostridium sp.]|jgi:hypothetical protein
MKEKSGHYKNITKVYLILQLLLYVSFLYIDMVKKTSYDLSADLKFAGIILCFFYTLILSGYQWNKIDVSLLKLALFFTLISDYFILMLDIYLPGVLTFCAVQSIYLIRLGFWRKQEDLALQQNRALRHMIAKKFARNIIISFFLILCIYFFMGIDVLTGVVCFYFVSLLCNTVDSVILAMKHGIKYEVWYALGMVLFMLCDINVGIFNLSDYIAVSSYWYKSLYNFAAVAMWLFYLPAQVLITLSGQTLDK